MLTSPKIKPGKADKFVDEEEEIGVRRKEFDIFVTRNTSVARGPDEGDWNRNCGESSEVRVDPSNQRLGRG